MFDIGWTELLVIGVVALIVVGPKDLPGMFQTLGRFTAKARGMAREFSRAMEDAANETGVKDIGKTLKDATSPKSMGLDKLKDAATNFEKWDPLKDKKDVGPATAAMTEERAEAAEKIRAATAKTASARVAAEKEASAPAKAKTTAAKKTAAKKPAAKKPAGSKAKKAAAAKKPAAKKPAAKKTTSKKASS
ncbi:MAG: Sec-independent protein translocase protein TatB [Marinosulfonomonas sp.]